MQVCLELLVCAGAKAISAYLQQTLNSFIDGGKAQQAVVCAMMVEQYLIAFSLSWELDANSNAALQLFLHKYCRVLHVRTTFQLIASFGCSGLAASYAEEIGLYQLSVANHVHDHCASSAWFESSQSSQIPPHRLESYTRRTHDRTI